MALSPNQVKHVCLDGAGYNTCRYLAHDTKDYKKKHCIKLLKSKKKEMDEQVKKWGKHCKASGIDVKTTYVACGDGGKCQGYPLLVTITQGYDVKKP